jgi:predicted nucleotidyltransferase
MTASKPRHLSDLADKERQIALAFVDKVQRQFDGKLISAILFGSRARGDAEPDSDMDMLVVMSEADPETRKAIHHLAVEVWLEYGIYLSTLVWSRAHWQKVVQLRTLLYQNIRRDGIDLLTPHRVGWVEARDPTTSGAFG